MTDREYLKSLGLTEDEIDEMQEDGFNSWSQFDVEAQQDILQKYLDAGLDEQAENMLSVLDNSVNYWETLVEDLTGRGIYYNDVDQRWHDSETHQYVKDPYFDTHADDYELEQWILNTYS